MKHLVICCFFSIVINSYLTSTETRTCSPCKCEADKEYGGILVRCSGQNLTAVPTTLPAETTTLLLNHSRIYYLHNQSFNYLQNLRKLDLYETYAFEFDVGVFNGLKQLQYLIIKHLSLGWFSNYFPFLTNLTHFEIPNCYVEYDIDITTFRLLIHLQYLNLTGCTFGGSDLRFFSSLSNLRILDISFLNYYEHSDSFFSSLTMNLPRSIEVIRYTYNLETDIDMNVFTFLLNSSLKELYFDAVMKTVVKQDAFLTLPKTLQVLSLRNYLFKSVSLLHSIMDLSLIRKLDLSGTEVRDSLQCMINFVPVLVEIFICSNCICKNIQPIDPDSIISDYSVTHLTLDNTNIGALIEQGEENLFKRFSKLTYIDVSSNRITILPRNVFQISEQLKHIIISDNLLQTFDADLYFYGNLETLDLSYNRLQVLPLTLMEALEHQPHVSIHMRGNPLVCTCGTLDFLKLLQRYRNNFKLSDMDCRDSVGTHVSLNNLDDIVQQLEEECTSKIVVISVSVSAVVCVITAATACAVYRHRWKLRYLYHVGRRGYRRRKGQEEGGTYKYDAFVSYADEDRRFVIDLMMPELEERNGMKLCIHHRDFLPGEVIATSIVDAIQNSRKTIVVLSPSFLTSTWCEYEYNMARMEGVSRRQELVLVVLYQPVRMKDLPKDMALMFRHNCYLEYNDGIFGNDVFWRNIIESVKTERQQD